MEMQKRSTVLIFFLNGVNSLLGWSVVLVAFDFFASSFSSYNVYSFLPVPVFTAYILTGVFFHFISNKFKYIHIIIVGNTTMGLALIALLIVPIVLEQTEIGYILMLTSAFFIGFGLNLSQLCFFAMINYLSQNVVSKFTVGVAVCGLLVTCIRVIITLIFGVENNSNIPIIAYFTIASVFNVLDLILNLYFCSSKVYKQKIQKHDYPAAHSLLDTQQSSQIDESIIIQKQNYFKTLYDIFFKIKPYPIYIMLVYILTFSLYPGPIFTKPFPSINNTWAVILFNLFYNIGDTIGRYCAQIKQAFNPKSLAYVLLTRLFFIFSVTFMAKGWDSDDSTTNNNIFPFLNILLFAITNGFCTNASFIMAFRVCPQEYKKYAGVLCGLILEFGIIFGSILQIPYSYILGIN